VKWKLVKYEPQQTIIREGENDQNVYIVIDGTVIVTTNIVLDEDERREMGIAKLSRDDIFGEISMFDKQPRSANVIAESACDVAVMDCESFNDFLQEHTDIGYWVMRCIVEQLVNRMRHNNIRSNSILAWYLLETGEPLRQVQ
jgi:CRP/FNR family cyclic AMP-dependent transcriptional regulator